MEFWEALGRASEGMAYESSDGFVIPDYMPQRLIGAVAAVAMEYGYAGQPRIQRSGSFHEPATALYLTEGKSIAFAAILAEAVKKAMRLTAEAWDASRKA